jgi:CubicO group peptidase (beta-lactamase class C family)
MQFICRTLLAGLVAIGVGATPIDTALAQETAPLLPTSEELTQLLDAFDVPGVAVATLTNCEVDGVVVAGSAMLAPDVAVAPLTAFEAASLSKPLFAWLVLALAEEGVIDLDRPITEAFDYERIPDKAAYAKITPRMVLTHRTGLPNWVDERVNYHDRTAPIPFKHPPGTAYSYSGEAFQLLQAYVEKLTGTTLEVLFREWLGDVMPHSTFAQPLPAGVTASRGYRAAGDPTSGRDMTSLRARGMAAASLATTARDYARFLAHVCKGEGLRPDTYADMLRPQSPVPEGEVASAPTSWGLGWMLADLGYGTFVGHGGDNNEYRALAGFVRESGDGLVVLTNGYNGRALIDAIAAPPPSEGPPQNPPRQLDETP